ncbi:MAG: patatin-like phospholipase family protein [Pseudomonadota bacterium]
MVIDYKFGSSGEAVRDLQRKLATLHDDRHSEHAPFYAGPCDGFYNRGMEKAIHDFKASHPDLHPANAICDEKTWRKIDKLAGSVFAETWQFEFDALRGELPRQVEPVEESQLKQKVHDAEMAGLAFSGGGIRSATFNLGILQALAELRLLRDFDYLSTVSGGGYIGAWFSKWLQRIGGNIGLMELKLSTVAQTGAGKREPEEIRFLRQYSNYLTAKTGFFSADTWTVVNTYFRNTLLNLTILVAVLGALLVVPRVLVVGASKVVPDPAATADWMEVSSKDVGFAAIAAVLWSVFWIAVSISTRPDPARPKWLGGQSQTSVICGIVFPLMLAAMLGSLALWDLRAPIASTWTIMLAGWNHPEWAAAAIDCGVWLLAPGLAYFVVWCSGWALAQAFNAISARRRRRHAAKDPATLEERQKTQRVAIAREARGHFLCAVGALAVGALLVILTTRALAGIKSPPDAHNDPVAVHVLAFGMPVLLSLFGITMILSVGLVGRMYSEKSREWWSRQGGWTSIFVIAWLALVSVSLYAPALLAWVHAQSRGWASAAMGSAWVGTTVAGLLLGRGAATGQKDSSRALEFVAAIAPYVFCAGLLFLVSAMVHWITAGNTPLAAPNGNLELGAFVDLYNKQTIGSSLQACGSAVAIMLTIGVLLAWRVDINKFSMHMMYRNRLVRAYLGASNTKRDPHPFTGFDENDDINFDELLAPNGEVQKPFHIVNTALNMVNGKELAWQTRKAGAFTFTPAFCGFELPSMAAPGGPKIADEALRGSYRSTAGYRKPKAHAKRDDDGIKLGMAVAVSGAAASPNMGFHSSPPLAFLMTLFNVRLGRWFANPRRPLATGQSTTPRASLFPLFSELFGLTDAKSEHVYLSDGGHFENLGVYELVRRRCRLIVVIDAGADGKLDFDDLGNAIRKCSTDLRVEIDINVARIDLMRDAMFSLDHCVAGTIDYSKADGAGAQNGTLLYIKPSLLGTERADLLNYRKTNRAFPHQSTADQWFDETQFESYRSLGYQIGKAALAEPAAAALRDGGPDHDIAALCREIEAKWNPDRPAGGRGGLRAVGA